MATQRVLVLDGETVLWQAPVSTAAGGCGEKAGSFQTPRGEHRVAEKIGAEAAWGAVFSSRAWTGEIWSPDQPPREEDLVLTRILWLAGVETANANSQERYIYFHGTNHEDEIGQPASHGCIRLKNDDVLRLFDYAEIGTRVEIVG